MNMANQLISGLTIFMKYDESPYIRFSTLEGEGVMAVSIPLDEISDEDRKALDSLGWSYFEGDSCWVIS